MSYLSIVSIMTVLVVGTQLPLSTAIADMYEVSFPNSGGIARASDSLVHDVHGNYPPSNAFGESGFWHSATHLPEKKLLWYEFPEQIRVVKYSFKSRNDFNNLAITDGPSKYIFWASNSFDCSDETKWTKLYEDNSGTPFDSIDNPKSVSILNNDFYRCYGFKVIDTPGRASDKPEKPVTISDVHFYATRIAACPSDYYYQVTTRQCFKLFTTSRMSWLQASKFCKDKGMTLAHPSGPVELRQELVNKHGSQNAECWINVQYDGLNFRWQDDNRFFTNRVFTGSNMWIPKKPNNPTTSGCVILLVWQERMTEHYDKTYSNTKCFSQDYYPLCELKLN